MKTMKQENKMKKEKKERPAINIEMIDKNNNHNDIPPELSSYIHGKKFELYLSGNKKLCNSNEYENSEACTPLCSEYCYSRNHKNNGCDPACNSKECNYDGGDCAKIPLYDVNGYWLYH